MVRVGNRYSHIKRWPHLTKSEALLKTGVAGAFDDASVRDALIIERDDDFCSCILD